MKKVFALVMAIFYLAVSSGLALEIHHCMGEVKDFSFVASQENKCDSCGMEKGSSKCCKDELKFVKLQDSYKLLNVQYEFSAPEVDLQNNLYLVNTTPTAPVVVTGRQSPSPPGAGDTPLNILNSVFRI